MAKTAKTNESIPFGPQIRNNALRAESNTFYEVSMPLRYKAPRPQGVAIAQGVPIQRQVSPQSGNFEEFAATTQGYQLRDSERVIAFLQRHSDLCAILPEARHQISIDFPDSPLALEVVCDPEGDASLQLVVAIMTSLTHDQALARLDAFDDRWWLDAPTVARRNLSIILEFA